MRDTVGSKNHQYWIIGYKPDVSFIIIGVDTGPYSELPRSYEEMGQVQGRFLCVKDINNPIGDINFMPPIPQCPFLEELLRIDSNEEEPFGDLETCLGYIKKQCDRLRVQSN